LETNQISDHAVWRWVKQKVLYDNWKIINGRFDFFSHV